jgi:hypothetical protein
MEAAQACAVPTQLGHFTTGSDHQQSENAVLQLLCNQMVTRHPPPFITDMTCIYEYIHIFFQENKSLWRSTTCTCIDPMLTPYKTLLFPGQ